MSFGSLLRVAGRAVTVVAATIAVVGLIDCSTVSSVARNGTLDGTISSRALTSFANLAPRAGATVDEVRSGAT